MSTVRKRDAAATREKILDAAEELFAERGYHGVSIREIVGRAGVDLALVHYYFGPKDALFREVIERRGAVGLGLVTRLTSGFGKAGSTGRSAVSILGGVGMVNTSSVTNATANSGRSANCSVISGGSGT